MFVVSDDLDDNMVLIVAETTSVEAVGAYFTTGVLPDGAQLVDMETYLARGRAKDCDCDMIECVCAFARGHEKLCRFRVALTCAIGFSCKEHGFDVCPVCDPCTCKVLP